MNALNRVTLEPAETSHLAVQPDLEELAEVLEPNPESDARSLHIATPWTANPFVLIGGVVAAFVVGAGLVLIIVRLTVPAPGPSATLTTSLGSATTKPAVTVLPKQPMVALAPPAAAAPQAPAPPRKYISARTGRHPASETIAREPMKASGDVQNRPAEEQTQQPEEQAQRAQEPTQPAVEKPKALEEWIDPFQQ
jgi:hypothetical protein